MSSLDGGVQGRVVIDFRVMSMFTPQRSDHTSTPSESTPHALRSSRKAAPYRRLALPIIIAVTAIGLAHVLDRSAWTSVRDPQVYERDLGRLLRSMGYLPTWLIVAIGCWTHDRPARGWGWRGGLVILAPLTGGAVAEGLKLAVRRLRPDAQTFGYVFRPFADHPFSTGGLGMPSSHTLVAFAGATALARVFPRAWWLWYFLATGCAITRVMANAHFLSDTVAAAALGWFVGELLSRWMLAHRENLSDIRDPSTSVRSRA